MSRFHHSAERRIPPHLRRRILDRDGRRCRDCGKAGRLEVHHVVHLANGGGNDESNLRTLCRDCHIRAHRRPVSAAASAWQEFMGELA